MGARWFVRGDLDGFFGLALDNLVQLLLIDALCRFVLGFDAALLYGKVLPAAPSAIADRVAERLPAGRVERFDDLDHMGPFAAPRRIAARLQEFCDELSTS